MTIWHAPTSSFTSQRASEIDLDMGNSAGGLVGMRSTPSGQGFEGSLKITRGRSAFRSLMISCVFISTTE